MSFKKSAENAGMALLIIMLLAGAFYLAVGIVSVIIHIFKPGASSQEREQLARLIVVAALVVLGIFFYLR